MISIERIAANRANALKSTGPKSDEGKKHSALNATRHGLTGQTVVMPTDDLNAYTEFLTSFQDDLNPGGALEKQFVQQLADCSWRLNRASAWETNQVTMEAALNADQVSTGLPQVQDAFAHAAAADRKAKTLANMSMYVQRTQRTMERILKQLQEVQAARFERERVEMEKAILVLSLHKEETRNSRFPIPYNPQADGFVFTAAQIEAASHKTERIGDARHFAARGEIRAKAA